MFAAWAFVYARWFEVAASNAFGFLRRRRLVSAALALALALFQRLFTADAFLDAGLAGFLGLAVIKAEVEVELVNVRDVAVLDKVGGRHGMIEDQRLGLAFERPQEPPDHLDIGPALF